MINIIILFSFEFTHFPSYVFSPRLHRYESISSFSLSGIGHELTGLTTIKTYGLRYCTSLTTIDLTYATSLTTIGTYAFDGCTNLQSIKFGSAVTNIGFSICDDCTNLSEVTFNGSSLSSIDSSAFNNRDGITVYVYGTLATSLGVSSGTGQSFYGASNVTIVVNSAATAPSLSSPGTQENTSFADISQAKQNNSSSNKVTIYKKDNTHENVDGWSQIASYTGYSRCKIYNNPNVWRYGN